MVLQQVFLNLMPVVWWLIPIILIYVLSIIWSKGRMGERVVQRHIRHHLAPSIYLTLHDVTIKIEGGTTQIDHVIVSKFGIFVIETKNYSGWIFGNEKHATWTQSIYGRTYKFQNPLRQNYKHLKALEAVLNVPISKMKPVIVFIGRCEFKTQLPDNVTFDSEFIHYIQKFNIPIFTDQEVKQLHEEIQLIRLKPSFKTNREHVRNLKKKIKS